MKILLVEDDRSISRWLSDTLIAHRYAVDVADDGAAGLALALDWPYDLVILDWVLPSLSGLEVCRRLRSQGSPVPVLMLTVRASSEDVVAGLDAGADDYLAKSGETDQLLARLRALLRRSDRLSSPVLSWGDLCLDPALTRVTYQERPVPCRPKEYELLELFLRQPQRLLTRSAIIDHLWPMDDVPVEGSITNLIKDLRQRLRQAGLTRSPIETVYGQGYRLRPIAPLPPAAAPVAGIDTPTRLSQVVQEATQRFRNSLEQRLTVLEGAVRSLSEGDLSAHQQRLASTEAHKLAGGLGLFGYGQAAAVAETIELLLQTPNPGPLLAQHLEDLKQSLTLPVD